jgi:hypothetical protein
MDTRRGDDMLRLGRSGWYRLIAAKQLESIKIGPLQRGSVASIRHLAAESAGMRMVEARTERSGESATPEEPEEAGHVLSMTCCGRQPMSPRFCVPVQTIPTRSDPLPEARPRRKDHGQVVTCAIV